MRTAAALTLTVIGAAYGCGQDAAASGAAANSSGGTQATTTGGGGSTATGTGANGSTATTAPVGWAKVGADGMVLEVGATVPFATLTSQAPAAELQAALPQQAELLTGLNHLGLNFETQGHPPPPYEVPHFDFHFYLITPEEQAAVDCANEPMPPAAAVPAGYLIPSTAAEPTGTCVPQMGVHAVNTASPELNPTQPAPFTSTLILGYHAGELSFIEPMVAQDQLAAKQTIVLDVATPTERKCAWWPTKFTAVYNPLTDAYDLALSDFKPHD